MLTLNKLTLDSIKYDIERAENHLEAWVGRYHDSTRTLEQKQKSVFKITSFYTMLAYGNYALENFDQVKPNLEKAVPYAFLRGFSPELRTHNTDLSIHQDLNLVILFGDAKHLQSLANSSWTREGDDIMYLACLMYDHLLIKLGTGQHITQAEIASALLEAQNSKERDVLQYILPLIEAIQAIFAGDKALWQSSIDKVITWHTDQCKYGWLNDTTDGFMNLNALTMAKLGKDMHGWECETDSVYLPLFLIA